MDGPSTWSDAYIKSQALNMWANYIETGNVVLSARDSIERRVLPLVLSDGQLALVARMRALAAAEIAKEGTGY